MTPAPQNAGLNPRYVPPQRRDMYENDPTIRPESSMSNASFATQFPQGHGGVSLNNLTSGANGGTPSVFGNQDGNFGPGYGGPAGPGPGANMYGNSGNFAGYSQNPGNSGPPSTAPIGQPPSPYGMVPGGYGQSFGGFGPGPGGYGSVGAPNHGMGGMQQASSLVVVAIASANVRSHHRPRQLRPLVVTVIKTSTTADTARTGRVRLPTAPPMTRFAAVVRLRAPTAPLTR